MKTLAQLYAADSVILESFLLSILQNISEISREIISFFDVAFASSVEGPKTSLAKLGFPAAFSFCTISQAIVQVLFAVFDVFPFILSLSFGFSPAEF